MGLDVRAGRPMATLMARLQQMTAEALQAAEEAPAAPAIPATEEAVEAAAEAAEAAAEAATPGISSFDALIRETITSKSLTAAEKKERINVLMQEMSKALNAAIDAHTSPAEQLTQEVIKAVQDTLMPVIEQQGRLIKALQEKLAAGTGTTQNAPVRKTLSVPPSRCITGAGAKTFEELVSG